MKRIILFVSEVRSPAPKNETYTYDIEGQTGEVTGLQTNEAPVKVLMRIHPDIEEVIAIVTEAAKAPKNSLNGKSSYEYFRQAVCEEYPSLSFFPVDALDKAKQSVAGKSKDNNPTDFNGKILPDIIGHVEADDTIYLDTTGGLRSIVTDLMQLSQVLTYRGITVERAVYSNYFPDPKVVEDVTSSFRPYSLISGLNEFQNYGTVDTLKDYFAPIPQSQELKKLLDAMGKVFDAISMCRLDDAERNARSFKKAMAVIQKPDVLSAQPVLLQWLLPTFAEKFRELDNTYLQLKWCLNNNLIQQALTIYTDRIPAYLIREKKYLTLDGGYLDARCSQINGQANPPKNDGAPRRAPSPEQTKKDFFTWANNIAMHSPLKPKGSKNNDGKTEPCIMKIDPRTYKNKEELEQLKFLLRLSERRERVMGADPMGESIDHLSSVMKDTPYRLHPMLKGHSEEVRQVLRDFLFSQTLRNMVNHASSKKITKDKKKYLKEHQYPVEVLPLDAIKETLNQSLNHLETLAKLTNQEV